MVSITQITDNTNALPWWAKVRLQGLYQDVSPDPDDGFLISVKQVLFDGKRVIVLVEATQYGIGGSLTDIDVLLLTDYSDKFLEPSVPNLRPD